MHTDAHILCYLEQTHPWNTKSASIDILSLCLFLHVRVWSIMSSASVLGLFMPVLFLLALAVVLFSCVLRKRRQVEGSYQPSAEEQKQAKNNRAEKPGLALPLPKEERLIWTQPSKDAQVKPHTTGKPKQNFHYNGPLLFKRSPIAMPDVRTHGWSPSRRGTSEVVVGIQRFRLRCENAFTP